jgi:hypothetical protein
MEEMTIFILMEEMTKIFILMEEMRKIFNFNGRNDFLF